MSSDLKDRLQIVSDYIKELIKKYKEKEGIK